MDGYEQLAQAIVIQAAKDYKRALRALIRNRDNEKAMATRDSVERFFRSEWFMMLTNTNPNVLLDRLQEVSI